MTEDSRPVRLLDDSIRRKQRDGHRGQQIENDTADSQEWASVSLRPATAAASDDPRGVDEARRVPVSWLGKRAAGPSSRGNHRAAAAERWIRAGV